MNRLRDPTEPPVGAPGAHPRNQSRHYRVWPSEHFSENCPGWQILGANLLGNLRLFRCLAGPSLGRPTLTTLGHSHPGEHILAGILAQSAPPRPRRPAIGKPSASSLVFNVAPGHVACSSKNTIAKISRDDLAPYAILPTAAASASPWGHSTNDRLPDPARRIRERICAIISRTGRTHAEPTRTLSERSRNKSKALALLCFCALLDGANFRVVTCAVGGSPAVPIQRRISYPTVV